MIDLLRKQGSVSIRKLDPADYVIGKIGVERKTITDFLVSLKSSRLFEQVARLKSAYEEAYLLVEGLIDWDDVKNPYWFCFALQRVVLLGVPVLFSSSQENSVNVLSQLAMKQVQVAMPVVLYKSRMSSQVQLSVLCAFNGIGVKRATKLLKEFGTLRSVFFAGYRELRRRGVSKCAARSIVDLLDLKCAAQNDNQKTEILKNIIRS